jgi:hypothetical protein
MTELITLTLTLEELKLLTKYIKLNKETQKLFIKLHGAYPDYSNPVHGNND